MGDSFTIQISNNLVNQLVDDAEKLKKKTRKPKTKIPRDSQRSQTKAPKQIPDDSESHKESVSSGWPLQSPLFLPVPPPQSATTELDAIRSVVQESERVLERLQNQEEAMLQEVTQRAKDLHDKEFKLPYQKPIPCSNERDAVIECYKEHVNDTLKCANVVERLADCARRVKQQMSSPIN